MLDVSPNHWFHSDQESSHDSFWWDTQFQLGSFLFDEMEITNLPSTWEAHIFCATNHFKIQKQKDEQEKFTTTEMGHINSSHVALEQTIWSSYTWCFCTWWFTYHINMIRPVVLSQNSFRCHIHGPFCIECNTRPQILVIIGPKDHRFVCLKKMSFQGELFQTNSVDSTCSPAYPCPNVFRSVYILLEIVSQ